MAGHSWAQGERASGTGQGGVAGARRGGRDGLSGVAATVAGEKGMGGAHQGAQEGKPGTDSVPTSLPLSAAVLHRWGACMGGGGA